MHNSQIKSLGLDAIYIPLLIDPKDLKDGILGMRALNIKGFNVTIPHKEAIMPLLDEIEPSAKAIGAVNTVIRDGNRLIGTNTDCSGFTSSLKEKNIVINHKKILVLGAGGAARAIVYGLCEENAQMICVANRSISRAKALIEDFSQFGMLEACTLENAMKETEKYDMIVNTTSVGMYPNVSDNPLPNVKFKSDAVVVDIIYNPSMTALLQWAQKSGCQVINGLGMFVHQGAIAFSRWTGMNPNLFEMEAVVKKCLEGKK